MIRVGVDWGSTTFRAYRFDENGVLVAQISADKGIREIQPPTAEHYEKVLFELIGSWLYEGDIVLLSGMITSRTGWIETPYLSCPVDVTSIANCAQCIETQGIELRFLPGIKQENPAPDVMRGEELQLLGVADFNGSSTIILPGTHSKWATMKGSELAQFRTVMTGELFELISKNSLVGAVFSSQKFDENSFMEGVELGYETTTLVSDLFTLRSSVILEQANSNTQHSRLSGMLIGSEIREGLQMMDACSDIVLVGAESLCLLYQRALTHIGKNARLSTGVAAVEGFQQIAKNFISDAKTQ